MNEQTERKLPEPVNRGLTMPGPCESCGTKGPRFQFYNDYVEKPVAFKLCPRCMSTALACMYMFFRTTAGAEALKKKLAGR